MNALNNPRIATDHPVFDAFWMTGYPSQNITDPANVTREDIESGEWRALVWDNEGVSMYDVDASSVVEPDWSPTGVAVEHNHDGGTTQPIGFADEAGPTHESIGSMKTLRSAANPRVTFFADRRNARVAPALSPGRATEILHLWGSEGYIPRETAERLAAAFDTEFGDGAFFEDTDAEGVELMRAPHVVKHLTAAAIGRVAEENSTTVGHKKRRRTEFYDNLAALADKYDAEPEW